MNKQKSKNNNITIYILSCKNNKYYVGKTTNVFNRIDDHIAGNATAWTKKYPPIDIIELHNDCDPYDEDKYTLQMMNKYGIDNVRGGSFTEIVLDDVSIAMINKMNSGATDKCFNCNKSGHFANECNMNNVQATKVTKKPKVNVPIKRKSSNAKCYRCGRAGHLVSNCYASKHVKGYIIDNDESQDDNDSEYEETDSDEYSD